MAAAYLRAVFGFRHRWVVKLYFWLRAESLRTALYGIDEKLVPILGRRRGYYVELGANDGISQSNSLLLEVRYRWRGVLIEPIRANFDSLVRNRNRKRNVLVQAACVSHQYPLETVTMTYLDLMSVTLGVESDLPDLGDHYSQAEKFLKHGDPARTEVVPARTLTSILNENKCPKKIDLLSLDTEGSELEVLKGLDFDTYRISWVLVECRDAEVIADYLSQRGYRHHLSLTSHDQLFQLVS